MPDFKIERRCTGLVCGVDEAGRGPLAGPVVAAAVVLDHRRFPKSLREGLDDSKVLSIEEREACYGALRRCVTRGTAHIGVGAASGAQAGSLSPGARREERRSARVYSKALVEENRSTIQRQDRVPRR